MSNNAKVISNENFCANNMLMKIKAPEIASKTKPGQFINILCSRDNKLILRRPISVMDADSAKGTIDIAYEIRGEGTRLLVERKAGEVLDIMGPLGNGFLVEKTFKSIAIVGGGIGIYPLYYLAKKYSDDRSSAEAGGEIPWLVSGQMMPVFDEGVFKLPACSAHFPTGKGNLLFRNFLMELSTDKKFKCICTRPLTTTIFPVETKEVMRR